MERKIVLDNLPKWLNGEGKVKEGKINWSKCIKQIVEFVYYDIKGQLEILNYEPKAQYLWIKYLDKEPFKINTNNFIDCRLGKLLGKRTSEFKIANGTTFKDEYCDFTIIDRKYIKDKNDHDWKLYSYVCNKCNYSGSIREGNLLHGNGCSCCGINSKVVMEGINDIPTTAPHLIKYFTGGYEEAKLYTKSSGKKIFAKCPDCGRVKDKEISIKDIYTRNSIGCSCSDGKSYPEKFMHSVLEQLNIEFETQINKSIFNWCKKYQYDFYINSINCIIETHGLQHYKETTGNWKMPLIEIVENDMIKYNLAKDNTIKNYIIIDSRKSELEWMKNSIINSKLIQLINFQENDIDWLKCHEYACSNLVKIASELWNNGITNIKDIESITKLSRNTIRKYLKQGSKLNWCTYNSNDEKIKNVTTKSKPVKVFKENIFLGEFKSCKYLETQSEKEFGVKLFQQNISEVCNGKKKNYKGFVFEYVTDDKIKLNNYIVDKINSIAV